MIILTVFFAALAGYGWWFHANVGPTHGPGAEIAILSGSLSLLCLCLRVLGARVCIRWGWITAVAVGVLIGLSFATLFGADEFYATGIVVEYDRNDFGTPSDQGIAFFEITFSGNNGGIAVFIDERLPIATWLRDHKKQRIGVELSGRSVPEVRLPNAPTAAGGRQWVRNRMSCVYQGRMATPTHEQGSAVR